MKVYAAKWPASAAFQIWCLTGEEPVPVEGDPRFIGPLTFDVHWWVHGEAA